MSFYVDISDEEYRKLREKKRQVMKNFNICKKYFKSIKPYVYCDICDTVLEDIEIDKEDIRNGLQTGLYIYKYTHTNPDHDPDDPEDLSHKEHTAQIYIDANYDVRGVRCFFGTELSTKEISEGAKIPIVVKEIPPMSVHLGMLSPAEYKLLQTCDGNNTLSDVAEIMEEPIENVENMIKKLRDKGLVNLILRA